MCSDPENTVNGFCEGSAHVTTLVGNRVVAGNGKSGGASCGGFGQPKCRTNKQADAPQLNPRSTATPTVTPSPTNTPCPQAFICGLPTTTVTPIPYSEPIATQPVKPVPHFQISGGIYVDWTQVDGIDLAIDVAGITGDIGYWTGYTPYHAMTQIAEGAGLVKGIVDLFFGDPTNITYDQLITSLIQNAKLYWRLGSLVPGIGFIGNLGSMNMNLKPKFEFSITYH